MPDARWTQDWSLPRLNHDAVARLSDAATIAVAEHFAEIERAIARNRLFTMFPDAGPLRRDLYRQHTAFFRLGATCKTRCFMAANRAGKTEGGGGFEVALHLTGLYPPWWGGCRFDRPVDCWAAGDTKETVRDIIQQKLLGPSTALGAGLIPADVIRKIVYRQNGNGAVDYAVIKHASGRDSRIGFKSYDQGREAFQGTEKDIVWLDEEANDGIRSECAMRLGTTGGLLIETFTPLRGLTPIVLRYIGGADGDLAGLGDDRVLVKDGGIGMVMAGWDDVPHLPAAEKARMLAECEPHLRESRSKGVPSLGSGAIYPVPLEDVLCDPFTIPAHWPRLYGMDVGWRRTAGVWLAWDRDSDVIYAYSEHYRGQAEPEVHAAAIRARGDWIPGEIDPASHGRGQKDGEALFDLYVALGLRLHNATNAVEAGILEVYSRLSTGRLRIFRGLQSLIAEYRIYRRDEKGRIVKENDHELDALRYGVMGIVRAECEPVAAGDDDDSDCDDWRVL